MYRKIRVWCLSWELLYAETNVESQGVAIMKAPLSPFSFLQAARLTSLRSAIRPRIRPKCKQPSRFQRRYAHTPADDPYFQSIVDNPAVLVKSGQKHGPGLIVLSKLSCQPYIPRSKSNTTLQYSSQPSHLVSGRGRSSGFDGKQN